MSRIYGNKSLLHSEKHITAFTLWKEICKSQMNVFMATCGLLRSETPNSNGKCLNKHKIKCYSSDHQNEMNASRFSTGPFSLFHGCCTVATHQGVIPDGHVVLRVWRPYVSIAHEKRLKSGLARWNVSSFDAARKCSQPMAQVVWKTLELAFGNSSEISSEELDWTSSPSGEFLAWVPIKSTTRASLTEGLSLSAKNRPLLVESGLSDPSPTARRTRSNSSKGWAAASRLYACNNTKPPTW